MHLEEGPGTDAEGRPHGAGRSVGLAWVDLSTGQFYTQPATLATLPSLATRIGAQEVIVDPSVTASVSIQDVSNWTGVDSRLISQFGLSDQDATQMIARWAGMLEVPLSPAALSTFSSIELKACNLLLAYVQEQMQGLKVNLQPPVREPFSDTLTIDRSSIRGLELLRTARDQTSRGSLLYAVRRTRTKGGARLLQQRLTSPSASLPVINERLDLVSRLHDDESLRDTVVAHLDRTSDIQRLVQRFSLGRGDADDLLALARSITAAASVHTVLKDYVRHAPRATPASGPARDSLSSIQRLIDRAQLDGPKVLAEQIRQAIDEDGLTVQHRLEDDLASDAASLAHVVATTEGDAADLDTLPKRVRTAGAKESAAGSSVDPEAWVMRRDASPAIAKLHERLDRLRDEKEQLAAQLREHAGFASLSLKWTPRNGYIAHVRIPPSSRLSESQLDAIGARTLSASRSSRSLQIAAWTQLGARFDEIRGRVRAEETRIFEQLREQVIRNLVRLRGIAAVMDELDVACSFAAVAERHRWVRPIVTDTTVYRIVGGRHPTVELGLEEAGRTFVSNDCSLDAGGSSGAGNRGNGGADERTWLITGPNMAGKSTFLRQNALLVILAQAGSFVPAEYAEVGIVDRLFTRIGAADDLFRDQSTFMVEMLESATILRGATRRSFVVMDEVGRGTTPEDGASVAFACLNHLHNESRCRTLFATHFHAVADLTAGWDGLGRYCTDVRIHAPDAVDASGSRSHIGAGLASSFSFDHRLRRGMNRTSHALMVAQLAGLPRCVLEVAAGARQGMRGAHALPSLASGSPIQAPTTPRKVETVVAG
ncbi:DNA mismatch repair ATPase msh1 [Ascosphaera acerosa]|nr:DNA mismatch repair ATPase msh1 [Ascosphaera acerosa]